MIPFPRRASRPAPPVHDEPLELSVSDFQVVKVMREPTNPCIAFERTFAEGIAHALAQVPEIRAPRPIYPLAPPPAYVDPLPPAPRPRLVSARGIVVPRARRSRKRRSLVPWATAVMAIVVASGLVADEVKSGRFGRAIDAAVAFIDASSLWQ